MEKEEEDPFKEKIKPINQSTLSELFGATQRKVIIKNPEALNPDAEFIPNELYYRQEQVLELAKYFTEIINGLKPGHVVIRGQSGTGKTLTMKFVLNGFLKHAKEGDMHIGVAYASAHQVGVGEKAAMSPHRYIAELMKYMGYEISTKKRGGIGWSGMMDLFRDYINEQDFSHVIIICDDVHRLRSVPFIMHFARPKEVWGLNHDKVTVFFITDESQFVKNIPREALYSFENLNLYFPPYNAVELYGILRQRLEYALHTPDAIPDDIVRLIAAKVARKEGDARYAIRVLQTVVREYITSPDEMITTDHVEIALLNVDQEDYTRAVNALPKHAKIVLFLILLHMFNTVDTNRLYQKYAAFVKKELHNEPITFRRFYDYIATLEREDLITWDVQGRGRGKGKKSEVRLNTDMNAVRGIIKALRTDEDTVLLIDDWDTLEEKLERAHKAQIL